MPRRSILTARQRAALFDLPTDEATILYHYTLADDDLEFIRTRRHARNRLGLPGSGIHRSPGNMLGSELWYESTGPVRCVLVMPGIGELVPPRPPFCRARKHY